jgi:flagellin
MLRIGYNALSQEAGIALGKSKKKSKTSSTRLSTGLKINSAADDAAGLAISDKMTAQIRGMDRAAQNCEEGISMVDVADAALGQIDSMLVRIRELCVQSANGIYTDSDRESISKEVEQLKEEIDVTGRDTQYNKIKVLQFPNTAVEHSNAVVVYTSTGRLIPHIKGLSTGKNEDLYEGEKKFLLEDVSNTTAKDCDGSDTDISELSCYTLDFSDIKTNNDWADLNEFAFTFNCSLGCKQEFTFVFDNTTTGFTDKTPTASVASGGPSNNKVYYVGTQNYTTGDEFVKDLQQQIQSLGTSSHVGHDNAISFSDDMTRFTISGAKDGSGDDGYLIAGIPKIAYDSDGDFDNFGYDIILQVAANKDNIMKLDMPYITAGSLGLSSVDATTQSSAKDSILYIDGALTKVDKDRVRMGAYHNRLEYTYSNDVETSNNLSDSRSLIQDADMAKEMSDYIRENILQQAGISMMTNANQSMSNILELLQ